MSQMTFDDKIWQDLASRIAATFRMPTDMADKLSANKTARLVAAIPYVAGCDHPDRTALAHLATYILASSESCRHVFDHTPADDASPTARLAPIADFQGGDRKVIAQGMDLLAAIMINGYKKDIEKDRKSGEYNPILAGTWTDTTLSAANLSAPAFSSLMPAEEAIVAFWVPD